MIHEMLGILVQAIKITVFVLVMMMILEYITVQSKNRWIEKLKKSKAGQIIIAAVLGLIPGCMGTFAAVSMYIHRSISFAALVTALIATSGDEAFLMFSMIPSKALLIMGIIGGVAIITGFILQAVMKNPFPVNLGEKHFTYHSKQTECSCFEPEKIPSFYRNIRWERLVLLLAGLSFVALMIFGPAGHEHAHALVEDSHGHNHGHSEWGWERISFLAAVIVGLLITITVPNHFVKEHLWGHVIKKHFLKIFLWTVVAFVALHFLNEQLDIRQWIADNIYYVMLVAVVVGMIPESGPHIVFISLFMGGVVPLSVLVANSIVQDGHGSLPLLAESGRSFILAKAVNMAVGLIVGYVLLTIGL
jgi:hypothetical protein